MRKHRIAAAVLAACLVLSLWVPVSAAAPVSVSEAAQVVNALDIMVGDAAGNLNLSSRVTRAEFITMAVKATPGGDQIGQAATSPYPDVPWNHWASGFIEAGVAAGLASGYADGTFRPSREITLAEGVTVILRLLDYGPSDFSGAYPTGQLAMYRSLKLNQGVSAARASDPLTRQDAMYLFYNLMTANTKGGVPYLECLGHTLNGAGEIDLVSLINTAMEGPVVAQGDWKAAVPFDLAEAAVYRNGKASGISAIGSNDVVYWNSGMKTLWAYSDTVTGTIQALEPTASHPTAVTVSGRTCAIETSAAAYALSDLGQYSLGDTVTLLLGRDGGVAAVMGGGVSGGTELVGVVTAIEDAAYSDGKGGSYQARTVVLLATDGRVYRFESKSGLRTGSLVRAAVSSQTGEAVLTSLSAVPLTGKVNAEGTKLGSYSFAENAEILDVSGGRGVRVYSSRLAGASLSGSMVKYFSLNEDGEINRMILNDVTGDTCQYGVLTKMESFDAGGLADYYSYEFDVGGVIGTISQTSIRYPVSKGPIQIVGDRQNPEKLYALTCAKTGELSGSRFVVGSQQYTLSENLAVYEVRGGNYYLSTLARVRGGDFTLTGWYDKTDSDGGRIRVIVAAEK